MDSASGEIDVAHSREVRSGVAAARQRARSIARFAAGFVVAALLGVSFTWAWGSSPLNLRERLFPKHLAVVEPGWLYRSGQIRENLIEGTLRDYHIDLILDLTHDLGPHDSMQVAEKRAAQKLGIEVRRIPMEGKGTGTVDQYATAVAVIARAGREGRHVLVHCRAGDRRTGGVLAAYDVLVMGKSVDEARQELERFSQERGVATTLTRFLDDHLDEIAQRLVEMGVIVRAPDSIPAFYPPVDDGLDPELDATS